MRLLTLTAAAALALGAVGPALAADLSVAASNDVLATMTRAIAGDGTDVTTITPDGADPATWTPDIPGITAIQQAGLIVLNGAGYEAWAGRVSLPRSRTVDTTAGMADGLIHLAGLSHSHGNGPAHSHDGVAPVVWLDFGMAAQQAQVIAIALDRHAPADADAHAVNLAALQDRLSGMQAKLAAIGADLAGQTVMVAHPGYEYLARAADMTLRETTFDAVVPATPEQLTALDAAMADTGARIMLWRAAPPSATADALAARDVAVVVMPDGADTTGTDDAFDLIDAGLAAFAAAAAPK